jgi:hypothetical protein
MTLAVLADVIREPVPAVELLTHFMQCSHH